MLDFGDLIRNIDPFIMWNDRETPIAVFFSFRSYGTWLHGDPRGSVNRFRNTFGTRRLPTDDKWVATNQSRMTQPPVYITPTQRKHIQNAIKETCEKRGWLLHAMNVRTNHAHIVAAIGAAKASIALNAFKANATRHMRGNGCWSSDKSPWAERGSKRKLWNENSLWEAVNYVLNGQGDDLPDF